ncbi:MAG: hypothetical protein VXV97_09020, partial [Pseudomonadota bacterium]|nr:hypothetical protein [Pseudomonadota bacterium]
MNSKKIETINMMEVLITREIQRLAEAADVTVFVRYADSTLKGGPLDFVLVDKELPDSDTELPIRFDFQGLGIWFLCQRTGETFHMRHVIVEIDEQGKFSHGHVGEQEGYWEDFPVYISDERLLGGIIHAR